jgi:hypothetical protein
VVGVCVQVRSAQPTSGTGGATSTVAPSATAGTVVAVSVEISPAVKGRCTALGGVRAGGTRPSGAAGEPTRPAGTPDPGRTQGPGAGGNGPDGNGIGGLGAFGKVTAVGGAGFTVESSRPQTSTAVPSTAVPSTAVPSTQTVRTSSATTYTRTETATAKALAVGLCVTALGKADETGSVAATSITLRPAQNGSCSPGFGGRGPGGRPTSTGGGSGA